MFFKCKMCGGTLEFEHGATIGVCDSCGTKQTLPRLDDDRRANLYDRANHFRRNNEFDKAAGLYEQILNEDPSDAEAYWSLVLCRYGIEYVEDPATHKRVPTINRTQFTSIYDDEDYKSALQHSGGFQRSLYEEEAFTINEIQKGVLAISQKEDPFDVFICYKETDANGRRTQDSVIANDLYHQLTQEGFKVFFARITLEEKLGTAYEPYIFAALNSAKVMVVLGTRPEYFNAVWVKNEWSRYLALVNQSGGKKVLIPAYRDMDPYDLPEEFSHLQAQDMSKLGFLQDLIRGIKKIAKADEPKATVKETVVVSTKSDSVAPLLERAFLFIEDGNWHDANIYCEKVLDRDPKNAEAYLGKLMVELKIRNRKELGNCLKPFDNNPNYDKILRFGDEELETEMRGYIAHINERIEYAHLSSIYSDAVYAMNTANTESAYIAAAEAFKKISGFKDANTLAKQCLFESEHLAEAKRIAAEKKRIAAEKAAKKRNRILAILTPFIIAGIAFVIVLTTVIIPNRKYKNAMAMIDSGDYEAAYTLLEELGKYDVIASSKYDRATTLMDSGDYEAAYTLLYGLDYKDSASKLISIQKVLLSKAQVGSYVSFGLYEQDNNPSNGKETIEWRVLAKEDDRVLLISKYALDSQVYDPSNASITWENCSLRKWLNDTFLSTAFSEEEKAIIPRMSVETIPGNSTTDQVFLLSHDEALKYFSSDEERRCIPTPYALAQAGFLYDDMVIRIDGKAPCWWWLRSPGSEPGYACLVLGNGKLYEMGAKTFFENIAIRPALWVKLGS